MLLFKYYLQSKTHHITYLHMTKVKTIKIKKEVKIKKEDKAVEQKKQDFKLCNGYF